MKTKSHLLFTENFTKALAEIEEAGGHATQKFTDVVFVADLPDGFAAKKLKYAATKSPDNLDDVSALMVKAWKGFQAKQRATAKKAVEPAIPWDAEGFQHPRNPDNDEQLRKEFEEQKKTLRTTGTPTSETMTGSIALGLIIVAGTASDLGFSDAETRLVVQQVMEGCQFLASVYPRAKVTFVYVTHILTIDAAPNNQCNSGESCEAIFRDPALVKLGYAIGYSGCVDFVNGLRKSNKTNWAYVAFITKYHLVHFAYAGGVRLCMEFSNDGWGTNQINKVFAHETCHIFGAADEYAESKCTCANSGINNVPNNNCANCTDHLFQHVSCLMEENVLSLCPWTMGQVGWINPAANSSPVYVEYDSNRHSLYLNKNNTISDIWYAGGSWRYQNLNAAVKGVAPLSHGNPFSVEYYSQHHTLYRDVNNNISDILYAGSWQYLNLHSKASGAPLAQGDPFSLVNNTQHHTLYRDVNNNITDIWYDHNDGKWQHVVLQNEAADAPVAAGDPFSLIYNSDQHNLYRDVNNKISDIRYDGSKWRYQDLHSKASGAPLAQGNPFSLVYYSQHHTLYWDVNNNLSDIYYDGSKWAYKTWFV